MILNPLVVPHNAVGTARNILLHQTQFRVALTCFVAIADWQHVTFSIMIDNCFQPQQHLL